MSQTLFSYYGIKLDDCYHPLYPTWYGMNYRCYSVLDVGWFAYGGRGIKVCDRWRFGENNITGFQCWLRDMGPKPTPWHSIDRIDPNGNYEPTNCRWATQLVQANNKRKERIRICPAAQTLRIAVANTYHCKNLTRSNLRIYAKAFIKYGFGKSQYVSKEEGDLFGSLMRKQRRA